MGSGISGGIVAEAPERTAGFVSALRRHEPRRGRVSSAFPEQVRAVEAEVVRLDFYPSFPRRWRTGGSGNSMVSMVLAASEATAAAETLRIGLKQSDPFEYARCRFRSADAGE